VIDRAEVSVEDDLACQRAGKCEPELHRQRGCNATDKASRTTPAAPGIAGHVPAGLLAHSGMTLLSACDRLSYALSMRDCRIAVSEQSSQGPTFAATSWTVNVAPSFARSASSRV
jgi:hypothetical protein